MTTDRKQRITKAQRAMLARVAEAEESQGAMGLPRHRRWDRTVESLQRAGLVEFFWSPMLPPDLWGYVLTCAGEEAFRP